MRIEQDNHANLQSSAFMPSGDNLTQESRLSFGLSSRRSSHLRASFLTARMSLEHLFSIGGVTYSLCGKHLSLITDSRADDCRMLGRERASTAGSSAVVL